MTQVSERIIFAIIGGVFGGAAYLLLEYLPNLIENERVLLLLFVASIGFFGIFLALIGLVDRIKAILPALGLAGLGAVLLWNVSLRFEDVSDLFKTPYALASLAGLWSVSIPFVIVLFTGGHMRDYARLFDEAWSLAVRGVLACAFTGLSFGVLWMSAYVLELVRFDLLKDALGEAWFAMPLAGAIFGGALAVVLEMQSVVQVLSDLILRLLRLLLPLIAVVAGLFLVLVPFQGLDSVFQRLSAAATIAGICLAGITFISATVDARDEDATDVRIMVLSARVLSLLLPFLAGIALYALSVRIGQYGLSPTRVTALAGLIIVAAYSLGYFLASTGLLGSWRAALRQVNIAVAGLVIGISFLLLSPIVNPEKLSSRNQLARVMSGVATTKDIPFVELKWDWGWAGLDTLERLAVWEEANPDADLKDSLTRLETAQNRYGFDQSVLSVEIAKIERIKSRVQKRPGEIVVPEALWKDLETVRQFETLCDFQTEDGLAGCLILRTDVINIYAGPEFVFFGLANASRLRILVFDAQGNLIDEFSNSQGTNIFRSEGEAQSVVEIFEAIRDGDYILKPKVTQSFAIGEHPPIDVFR